MTKMTTMDQAWAEHEAAEKRSKDYQTVLLATERFLSQKNIDMLSVIDLKVAVVQMSEGVWAAKLYVTLDDKKAPYFSCDIVDISDDGSSLPSFLRKQA